MHRAKLTLLLVVLPLGGCTLPWQRTIDRLSMDAIAPATAASLTESTSRQSADAKNPIMLAQHEVPDAGRGMTVDLARPPELLTLPPGVDPENSPADDGLNLDELQSLALASNPAVAEMHARVEALRGRWVQAGLPFNPVAQYEAEEVGNEGAAGLHSIAIGQTIVTADKLRLRQGVIAAEIRRAEANLAADRLRIETDVATAFTAALVAQRRVELVEQLQRIAAESVESVNELLVAAEVSRAPLLQAQTELQQAELVVETAQTILVGTRRQLASVVGFAELPPERLVGDLDGELPEVPYADALDQLLTASPELADRAAAVDRAQQALRLAHAQVVPNVSGQVRVGYNTGTDDTFTGVQVSIPLLVNDRNQGNIRRARTEITAASLALQRTELDLANRLADTLQRYQTARIQTKRLTDQIIPTAEESLNLSRQAFEVGETGYLQLLTAQRTLFQTRLQVLDTIAEARQAAAQIEGYLLQGSLQQTQFQPALDWDLQN